MLSSKTDRYGRRIHDRGNSALSHDAVKLLKTQDSGYLKTVIQQTRRTREKVEQQLYLAEERGDGVAVPCGGDWVMGGKHILFARDLEEQQILGLEKGSKEPASPDQDKLQESGQGDDTQSVERWKGSKSKAFRRVERAKAETKEITRKERALRKLRKRQKEGQQSRLMALRAREKTLIAAEQQLDHGRARMGNSVGGVNKAGVKWKIRERSK